MRLLIVEDDQDGREMLAELFRMHAWDVVAVPNTQAAIDELRHGGVDVVISDENLQGASGSAMLCEAAREGLLRNVGALMYTAEATPLELPPGVHVLQKPMGIVRLVDAVTAAATDAPSSGERVKPATRGAVELVLYVSDSAQSRRALRTMQAVLDELQASRVKVVIRNVDEEPLATAEDPIAVTPVLVKKRPGAQERFVGELESAPALVALIHDLEAHAPPSSRSQLPPSSRAR